MSWKNGCGNTKKQQRPCFDCADNTCTLNYYYEQKTYRKRKTIRNALDKHTKK